MSEKDESILKIGDFTYTVSEFAILEVTDSARHKEYCARAKAVTKLVKNDYRMHGSIEIID